MKKELLIKEQGTEAVEFILKHADVQSENVHVLKKLDAFNIEAIDDILDGFLILSIITEFK